MIRFLVSVLAWFVAAAIGLPLANVLLDGMHMDVSSYLEAVVIFGLLQGLSIDGVGTWVGATLILWVVSMAAAFLLPLLLLRHVVDESRERRGR